MLHLTDLDELIQKIRSTYVNEYVTEALTAYRAGAYRAAVATTWVAVCIDIIEKIKELSVDGDTQAATIERRLDGISPTDIPAMMRFESDLLDIASEQLEFISPPERNQLERLKEDRNFCVHPTFQKDGKHFNITPEGTRNHIVNACRFLFINQPTKGKVIIETLSDLVSQTSFPEDNEKAYHILSSQNYLGRAKEVVIRNFFICLLKKLLKDEPPPADLGSVTRICAAMNALHRINPGTIQSTSAEYLPRLLTSIVDKRIKILFLIMNNCSFLRSVVDRPAKLRLAALVNGIPVEQLAQLAVAATADYEEEIRTALLTRYNTLSSIEQLEILKGSHSSSLKDKAIKVFCEAGSYAAAYDYGKNVLLPYTPYFSRDDILLIFDGTISNRHDQIIYANGMAEVFAELYLQITRRALVTRNDWEGFLNRLPNHAYLYKQMCEVVGIQPTNEEENNA